MKSSVLLPPSSSAFWRSRHRRHSCAARVQYGPAPRHRTRGRIPDDDHRKTARKESFYPPSVALEFGFFFRDKRIVSAGEILRLHADRLSLGLGLDRHLEAHAPFVLDCLLGHAMPEILPLRQTGRASGRD